MLALGAIKQ